MNDRQQVIIDAMYWLDSDPLFLDTETTGLHSTDEIVEIAVLDAGGKSLLDTLIKPSIHINWEAQRVHGITNEAVANAPTFADIYDELQDLLTGRLIIVYNLGFDIRLLAQSARAWGIADDGRGVADWACAMLAYADFWGDWNSYRGSNRWVKLTTAARQCGVELPPEMKPHRAAADAWLCRGVVAHMAGRGMDGTE
jgi:DNA polymerase-3 subunit epsilon